MVSDATQAGSGSMHRPFTNFLSKELTKEWYNIAPTEEVRIAPM